MNDRYLYKAKRVDNGEWIAGYLIKVKKDFYIYEKPCECMSEHSFLDGQSYGFGGFKFVEQSTICQCTGLKDKNGKLIWENDIVKGFYVDGSERFLCKIIWEECLGLGWCNKPVKSLSIYEWRLPKAGLDAKMAAGCEVIGNSFDNPELLEVKE